MQNQPSSKNRRRHFTLLTASAVGLSVAFAAFAVPARAAEPVDGENKALRAQNRELQAKLDARNALAAADEQKAAEAKEAGAGGHVNLIGKDLSGWKTRDEKAKDAWKLVGESKINDKDAKRLAGSGQPGDHPVLILEQPTHGADLISTETFGDCEVHVELMVPKGSNSGVYLMGQYEVQVLDSFGKEKVGPGDLGGIYNTKAPSENAAKPAGEWQSFDIVFHAPRFDTDGKKKTQNAKFVSVKLNGKQIHENVEAPKPTGSELPGGEKAAGPLMLQGDHGSVAFRNITVKPLNERGGQVGKTAEKSDK